MAAVLPFVALGTLAPQSLRAEESAKRRPDAVSTPPSADAAAQTDNSDEQPRDRSPLAIVSSIGQVMASAGMSLDLVWISEVSSNLQGGRQRKTALLNYGDLALSWDLDAFVGWAGATLQVRGVATFGSSANDNVGDLQFTSNIEVGDILRLYEAWLEQCVAGDSLCLLLGVYELANDFQGLDASGLFMHSSHFVGAALYWSGANGPSSLPSTTLAARLRLQATDNLYFLGAVTDGVPGAVADPSRFGLALRAEEGVHAIFEAGWVTHGASRGGRPKGKYALGVWRFTQRLDVLGSRTDQTQLGANGAYALVERRVIAARDETEGLWAWSRVGTADGATNLVEYFLGVGLTYRGLAAEGEEDAAGLAVAAAFASSGLREARRQALTPASPSEIAVEATYRTGLTPWLALQLSLHWVHHPNFVRELSDSVGLAGRVELSL